MARERVRGFGELITLNKNLDLLTFFFKMKKMMFTCLEGVSTRVRKERYLGNELP